MKNTIVIGGGPAGIMAAGWAAKKNKVVLIEQNEKLGKKLFITGKGRCNFTNVCNIEDFFENIVHNKAFMYSSLYNFTNNQTIAFFNKLGLREKVERGGRVFPASDKSSDVIKALQKFIDQQGVSLILNKKVKDIIVKDDKIDGVLLKNGEKLNCQNVILATGGSTYSQTGSTGDGYKFAESLGHNIVKPKGALIPLVSDDDFVKELQGLSLKNVDVALYSGKQMVKDYFGEMLFTHFGLSGPAILSLSSLMEEGKEYTVKINLKPALDEATLEKRILRDFEKFNNKNLKNALHELLPQKLISVIINLSHLDENKKVNQITKQERKSLRENIQNLKVSVKGKRPINEGIITSGGVSVKEINPSTMESKLVQGLYFAGEIIDVDALTGGFNLQIAFSTGYLAGINC